MIEGLIATTFAARNRAHLEHWNATSYAVHMALGEFYEELPDLVDEYVECYQGKFGKVGIVKLVPSNDSIHTMLEDDIEWIEENRAELTKGVNALGNLLDNITDLYMRTLYKLNELS